MNRVLQHCHTFSRKNQRPLRSLLIYVRTIYAKFLLIKFAPPRPPRSKTAERHVLDLHVLLDSVAATFTAQAAFLHTAEGYFWFRDKPLIDADDPVFEGFCDAEVPTYVASIEVAREAEGRVIREPNGLLFSPEPEE